MNIVVFIIIAIFSSIISGMGIGGGSIFIILSTMLLGLDHKLAQGYNLIIFILVGITASIFNIKDKKFDKKLFFKLIFLVIIGCIIGIYLASIIKPEQIRIYFYIFVILIGAYEIISSIKNIMKTKNINK
jgi:uncharacterized membrane protein YfcA